MSIFKRNEEYVIVADETTKEAVINFAITNSVNHEYGFYCGKGELPTYRFVSRREYCDIAEKLKRRLGHIYDVRFGKRGLMFVTAKRA